MKWFVLAALIALPLASALAENRPVSIEVHRHHQAAAAASEVSMMSDALTVGEVRKVDHGTGEIVLRHGRIKNMSLPARTMPFGVKDHAMLDQVKVGDRIRFAVDLIGGAPTITLIAPTR